MRLAAIATAYDSADIIEMFVRHTMRLVDRLYIHDDGSLDATREILGRLIEEGYDIVASGAASDAFQQARVTNALAARALSDEPWDFVIVLDDDEFLTPADRAALECQLASVPDEAAPALSVRHHLPSVTDDPFDAHPLRRMRRVVDWRPQPFKTIAPGPLLRRGGAFTDGNHEIVVAGKVVPRHVLPTVHIAHFPIRSAEQFLSRTFEHYVRTKLRTDYNPDLNLHRMNIAGGFRRLPGLAVSPEALRHIAHDVFFGLGEPQLTEAPFDATHAVQRHVELATVRPYDRILHATDGAIALCLRLREEVARLEAPLASPQAITAPSARPRKSAASRIAHRVRWFVRRRRRAFRAKPG
jgi:hypothetical protein